MFEIQWHFEGTRDTAEPIVADVQVKINPDGRIDMRWEAPSSHVGVSRPVRLFGVVGSNEQSVEAETTEEPRSRGFLYHSSDPCIDDWEGVQCGTSLWPPGQDECEDELSCAALGWDPAGHGQPGVCGSAALKGVGECGTESLTFHAEATALCADLGARLCSVHELSLDEANARECDLDLPTAWSWSGDADGCAPGHHWATSGASGDWIRFNAVAGVQFQIAVNGTRADQLQIDGMYDASATHVGSPPSSFVSGDAYIVRWNSAQFTGSVFFHVHRADERADPYSLSIIATTSYSWMAVSRTAIAVSQPGPADPQPTEEAGLVLNDNSAVAVELPWAFPFFGRPRTQLWVGTMVCLHLMDHRPRHEPISADRSPRAHRSALG